MYALFWYILSSNELSLIIVHYGPVYELWRGYEGEVVLPYFLKLFGRTLSPY